VACPTSLSPALINYASSLRVRNGKNSISFFDADGNITMRVDLEGASHGGTPTPHVVEFSQNIIPSGPRAGEIGSITPKPVRPATTADLNAVDSYLTSVGK